MRTGWTDWPVWRRWRSWSHSDEFDWSAYRRRYDRRPTGDSSAQFRAGIRRRSGSPSVRWDTGRPIRIDIHRRCFRLPTVFVDVALVPHRLLGLVLYWLGVWWLWICHWKYPQFLAFRQDCVHCIEIIDFIVSHINIYLHRFLLILTFFVLQFYFFSF